MDAYEFRRSAGRWGAYVSGKRVKNVPNFSKRLCRICSEEIARCRVDSLLLDGLSFHKTESLTTIPDSSITRHFKLCTTPDFHERVGKARRARRTRMFKE